MLHFQGEIRVVMKAGANPKKIIFAHTVKTRYALHYACSIGCDLLTFDSKEELLKIHKHFPKARYMQCYSLQFQLVVTLPPGIHGLLTGVHGPNCRMIKKIFLS